MTLALEIRHSGGKGSQQSQRNHEQSESGKQLPEPNLFGDGGRFPLSSGPRQGAVMWQAAGLTNHAMFPVTLLINKPVPLSGIDILEPVSLLMKDETGDALRGILGKEQIDATFGIDGYADQVGDAVESLVIDVPDAGGTIALKLGLKGA